ncbi:MAG: rod shape-determining protein MreD [Acidisphaera sp.]|nr:rod shape-determining protein MreD [Acidisphaera sp.]
MDQRTPGIRPRPSLGRQLDAVARGCFPVASGALLLLLLAAPLGLVGQAELQPALLLDCVFFWSLFRPASMPPIAVFVLGLLADLIGDAPIGANVLMLLIVYGLAVHWRRVLARQGFLLVWLVFCGVAVVAAAFQWALGSLLAFALLPAGPAAFQAALSAGCYPVFAALFSRTDRGLAAPEQA